MLPGSSRTTSGGLTCALIAGFGYEQTALDRACALDPIFYHQHCVLLAGSAVCDETAAEKPA